MSITVYLYDATTKEYLAPVVAHPSPLEEGKYLEPENTTRLTPPAPKEGRAIIFFNGAWAYVDDDRGVWFDPDGAQHEVDNLLFPVPDDWTREAPVLPEAPKRDFTPLEFLETFTTEEQLTVAAATMGNPVVKLWYDKMLAAQVVLLDDPRTVAGLDALVTGGLLTNQRRNAILGL